MFFESKYVPMLHYDITTFDPKRSDEAICTLQASSCFIVAIVCRESERSHFKGAYIAHINTRQLDDSFNLRQSFDEFVDAMKIHNKKNYRAILCGGTREASTLANKILMNLKELGLEVTNFRSIYSFPAEKLFYTVDLDSKSLDPTNIKKSGYMKQVSLGISKEGIKLFTEKTLISKAGLEPIEKTGRYSEVILDEDNKFQLVNITPERIHKKQPVPITECGFFQQTFNKNDRLIEQFLLHDQKAEAFLKDLTKEVPFSRTPTV